MANLETEELKAITVRDFKLAVKLFTQAISISPHNAELFARRSHAHFQLRMFPESLADAERAIYLDSSMHMAYFHKGNACYHLKDYQTAKVALESGSCQVPGNAKFIKWIKQCDERIAGTGYQRPSNPSSKRQRVDFDKVEAQEMEENREKLGADAFEENRENLADACQMKITGSGSQTPSNPSSKRQMENREKLSTDAFHEDRENLVDNSATVDLETQALKAIIFRDFKLAVMLFTQAILISSHNTELFAGRSHANFKLESLADAERAIDLDSSMHMAYFRKGKACYQLKDYQTAKAAFESGLFWVPGSAIFINLIKQCDECIAEKCGDILGPPLVKASTQVIHMEVGREIGQIEDEVPNQATSKINVKSNFSHQFYEQPEEVVVTILAKGILAQNVAVQFGEQSLSVIIHVPGEDAYHFQPSLFGKIAPEKCRYKVLPSKIEVHLAKAEPLNWTYLDSAVPHKVAVVSGTGCQRPLNPSPERHRIDSGEVEAEKLEENREKLGEDAF